MRCVEFVDVDTPQSRPFNTQNRPLYTQKSLSGAETTSYTSTRSHQHINNIKRKYTYTSTNKKYLRFRGRSGDIYSGRPGARGGRRLKVRKEMGLGSTQGNVLRRKHVRKCAEKDLCFSKSVCRTQKHWNKINAEPRQTRPARRLERCRF